MIRDLVKKAVARATGAAINLGLAQQGLRPHDFIAVDKGTQILLWLEDQELRRSGAPLPAFSEVGFRAYSQTDEDGILLYILALVGMESARCVEIGCEEGIEFNTGNLVINHGWHGLMIDGDARRIERGRAFYARRGNTWMFPPRLVHAWVDAGSVNTLLRDQGFSGAIDVLSIDLDGVDYWVWKAVECVSPRVVVAEYNNMWGPESSVTVPYVSEFRHLDGSPDYYGASLAALIRLGKEKGYRFVGCNRLGFNAFFVREGLAEDVLPSASPEVCLALPWAVQRREDSLPAVRGREWVEV